MLAYVAEGRSPNEIAQRVQTSRTSCTGPSPGRLMSSSQRRTDTRCVRYTRATEAGLLKTTASQSSRDAKPILRNRFGARSRKPRRRPLSPIRSTSWDTTGHTGFTGGPLWAFSPLRLKVKL